MKKALLICTVMVFLISCGGVKRTQEAINTGNYNQAISKALKNLSENKTKKGHQRYILLLEEAFQKNAERELQHIAFLQKEGNPANLEAIFKGYSHLKSIQQRIRPLLPLRIYDEGRDAYFDFRNYDNDILAAKTELSDYLYANANDLLTNATYKQDYRRAYDDFKYLDEINPGYSDTKLKMEEAYEKGLDYVRVHVINDTEQIIPERLEDELLNFNTFGLNDLWTQYHANPLKNVKYDYEMQVAFRDILISPEQISEQQIIKEKQIKDGYTYLEDANGNLVKDSLGNEIKVDRLKTVRCNFYQFTQHKAAQVTGNVRYIDLQTKQAVNSYPISSEFVFEHVYANYDGDKRALESNLVNLLTLRAVPFPSNEQMVYDAGEDLKARLKDIIIRHKFN
ncbi:hypothetical protein [Poritiphilus flavus]|uniref:Lipoprotein n=1 Tax=Poritiphilus flavus TaxID=2697053 RepID=A0A6L9EF60_9FLAO|nr:hypothetical protein [Poritiphilus flavus]NAS13410.1 hypothetical protein [Poritiphilus flavus]